MKTFILLLTLWSEDTPCADVYVLDSNMSGADCVTAMIGLEHYAIDQGGVLSCEFDYAIEGN